jgi:hypothetical protein
LSTGKDELILLRVDVIRDHVNVVCVAKAFAERLDQSRFARPDRAADTDAQRMRVGI